MICIRSTFFGLTNLQLSHKIEENFQDNSSGLTAIQDRTQEEQEQQGSISSNLVALHCHEVIPFLHILCLQL